MEKIEQFLAININSGYGDSDGNGSGNGSGYGDGNGSGFGYGFGSGYGDGIKIFNGNKVYQIDGIATIITSLHRNYAKGAILNSDLTLTDCFIAKCGDYFAHGETLKEAVRDVTKKELQNTPIEQRIEMFLEKFDKSKKYPVSDYLEWHGILTGSCEMGRKSFIKNHVIDTTKKYSVKEFVELTNNEYGGDVIKQIEQKLKEE